MAIEYIFNSNITINNSNLLDLFILGSNHEYILIVFHILYGTAAENHVSALFRLEG